MDISHFVWLDLSSYDAALARRDYAALFGWHFEGDDSYAIGYRDGAQAAAVFAMPEQFVSLKMPSFWMPYIRVRDLEAAVARAREHDGAKVEIAPQAFDETARIALIRDPSGAGFTLYEGADIAVAGGAMRSVASFFHHSAGIGRIEPFYADLFGWQFVHQPGGDWPVCDILDGQGNLVARAEEVPEEIRGAFSYWMPSFWVPSLAAAMAALDGRGGQLFATLPDARHLVADQQGAHFMLQEAV